MSSPRLNILVIEKSPVHAGLIKGWLNRGLELPHDMIWCLSLDEGMEKLHLETVDIIFLGLSFNTRETPELLQKLPGVATEYPLLIISDVEDVETARVAISCGAQDFLVRSRTSVQDLRRSLFFAMERHYTHQILQRRSNRERGTGLDDPAFFKKAADRELRASSRPGINHILLLFRIAHYDDISRKLGSNVYQKVGEVISKTLRRKFRGTDLVTRINEDTYAVFARDARTHQKHTVEVPFYEKFNDLDGLGHLGHASTASNNNMVTFENLYKDAENNLLSEASRLNGFLSSESVLSNLAHLLETRGAG